MMLFKRWIFTSLSPNAEPDDVMRALVQLCMPWAWREGRALGILKEQIKNYCGGGEVFLFSTGRGALTTTLASLGLKEGDEVVVQAYTCVAVPNAVVWAGLRPVYADIDPNTFNMSGDLLKKVITPETRAVIVQHTFGIPADMNAVLAAAKKYKLIVIEDLAHALGGRYNGKLLGTFGDAAILSFGRDKAISSVFGGAAIIHNKALAGAVYEAWAKLPQAGRIWIIRQLLHPIVLAAAKSIYGIFGIGKMLLAAARMSGVISKAVYAEEKKGGRPYFAMRRMPNALARLAGAQFEKLGRFVRHRETTSELYREELKKAPRALFIPLTGAEPSCVRFPLRASGAADIIKKARADALELGDWYNVPVAPAGIDYDAIFYEQGSCPEAEKAATESLNLPTHIGITEEDARRVIAFLRIHYIHA